MKRPARYLMALFLAAPVAQVVVAQDGAGAAGDGPSSVVVFDDAVIGWAEARPESQEADGYLIRARGQAIERRVQLPPAPLNQRDAQRIVVRVRVRPASGDLDRPEVPADPWPRLGRISVVRPADNPADQDQVIEIMRFVTGFGGETTYEADVTSYQPVLSGPTGVRARIDTWTDPGWLISLTIEYLPGEAGFRRPRLVMPVFSQSILTSTRNKLSAKITIPPDRSLPRLHILSTGHGEVQEFVPATHVIRIDGKEVARFRPWREDGGAQHAANPASERFELGGRQLWSSDLDRAGWMPGTVVDMRAIPLAELTPGDRTIEIEILGIRPAEPGSSDPISGPHWIVSLTVVADEPWPPAPPPEDDGQ